MSAPWREFAPWRYIESNKSGQQAGPWLDRLLLSDGDQLENRALARSRTRCPLVRQSFSPVGMTMAKYRPRQGPNLPTVKRIRDLAEYRERNRDQGGQPPTWTSACKKLGINYRTIRLHAPKLLEKWKDPDFHW